MEYAVYGKDGNQSLLLVTSSLWVINGDWQLTKAGDVFLHPLTGGPIDIKLLGYIEYDGDYSSTLTRFANGEGRRVTAEVEPKTEPVFELCKKQYYGIDCSCTKCKR